MIEFIKLLRLQHKNRVYKKIQAKITAYHCDRLNWRDHWYEANTVEWRAECQRNMDIMDKALKRLYKKEIQLEQWFVNRT